MHLDRKYDIRLPLGLCLALTSVLAFCVVLWTTPHGIGISPDSAIYFGLSESILKGSGFTLQGRPVTHFPPVYPTLLALVGWLGPNHLQMARLLHAVLFAANTFLIGIAAYFFAGRCFAPTLAAVLLFISSGDVLKVHTMAWSEPVSIFFTLAAFVLVALFVVTRRLLVLLFSAIPIGLALITRYAAIPLIPPIILTLLLQRKSLRQKIKESLILVVIGSAPLILWLAHNVLVSSIATNRGLFFHPVTFQKMSQLPGALCHFWLPFESGILDNPLLYIALIIGIVVLSSLILYSFVFATKSAFQSEEELNLGVIAQIMLGSFCVTYFMFVLISVSFFDAKTPLDSRIMAPVYVSTILFLNSLIQNLLKVGRKRWISHALIALVILSIFVNGYRTFLLARDLSLGGELDIRGYANQAWRGSETIAFIRSLPDAFTIYSDRSEAILFFTEKNSKDIPGKTSPHSLVANASFNQQLAAMVEEVRQGRAFIVYFDKALTSGARWWLPRETELAALPDVHLVSHFSDGNVYGRKDWRRLIERK